MGLVDHLTSPQFTDDQGRPTLDRWDARHIPLYKPGAPRWQGYVFTGVLIPFGALLLVALDTPVVGIIAVLAGAAGVLEVWRGRPLIG